MKLVSIFAKLAIFINLITTSLLAFSNENSNTNESAIKNGDVTVNFVAGTAFMASVCTDSGCSSFKFVGQSVKVPLSEGQDVCVSIYILPGVSTDVYFKKLNDKNDTINFWGMTASEHFNYTENVEFKLRDSNHGFANAYCRYLNYKK
ncbi:hypothetical protein [Silvanigrella sp.]|jgi:hypothetical protein|uniref:hypothetical protein n=1 Tax=Silvanigrella sp. TaxID=2024976 RepID=UPI0037C5D747|nr:hypothetical protein [Silvanigrellaceae bacterium]